MTHGDDHGLVLPPRIAPFKTIIIPIGDVSEKLEELKQNNLIEDGKVSLDSVYKEEEEVREKVEELFSATTFKVEDIEQLIIQEEDKSKGLQDSISSLEEQIVGLEGNITTLEAEYNRLAKEYEEKNSAYITGVPTINQYPDYPTGCESVALTILLKYYGVSVTPNDIINKLEKGKTPYRGHFFNHFLPIKDRPKSDYGKLEFRRYLNNSVE